MWRNWQTRRFQVPVGDRAGSNPVIRTSESTNFDEKFVDFIFIGELHLFDCYGIINKK